MARKSARSQKSACLEIAPGSNLLEQSQAPGLEWAPSSNYHQVFNAVNVVTILCGMGMLREWSIVRETDYH